MEQFFFVKKE